MPLLFLAIIIMVPYLEFLVFMKVGNEIGGFSALLLTLLSAFVGIYIIRQEGIQVLSKLKNTLDRGENPVSELIHGFFLAIAGVFFLLPGFITDTIAILLAIGPIRTMLGNMMINSTLTHGQGHTKAPFSDGIIIDGDFKESDQETIEKDQNSTNNDHNHNQHD